MNRVSLLRSFTRSNVVIYSSLGLLVIVTSYCAVYANYFMSGNSDSIVYPYLFKGFKLHDILLPSQHSNILKFPLYIFQAILPYNFSTFSLVNFVLMLITTLGWAISLIWLFGKRYTPVICAAMAAVLLGSQVLNWDLIGNTSRNIEYPIAFAFIIYIGKILQGRSIADRKYIPAIIMGILYALMVAGDSFFLYTIFISIFIVLIFTCGVSKPNKIKSIQIKLATGYLVTFSIAAIVIREAIKFLGIAKLTSDPEYLPHTLPLSHLGPSISTATIQLLNLFGANIFSQRISPSNSLVFLNFLLLCTGLAGLIYILKDVINEQKAKKLLERAGVSKYFTLAVLSLTFIVTYILYILSDLAVRTDSTSGAIVSAQQERYLTMLPFLLIVGVLYFLWRHFDKQKLKLVGLPLFIGALLIINSQSIRQAHVYDPALRVDSIAIAQSAQLHKIPVIVSGYWYGSTIRFWSHNKVMIASVGSCNIPSPPINNRLSWNYPDPRIHLSALVVAHVGIDASYSTCPDDQLISIYGKPSQIININTPAKPSLWLYDYDIRYKLKQ